MSYAEWVADHNAKIEAAVAIGDNAEVERLMVDADGFDEIDWSAEE